MKASTLAIKTAGDTRVKRNPLRKPRHRQSRKQNHRTLGKVENPDAL
jgi:hypothetical protein